MMQVAFGFVHMPCDDYVGSLFCGCLGQGGAQKRTRDTGAALKLLSGACVPQALCCLPAGRLTKGRFVKLHPGRGSFRFDMVATAMLGCILTAGPLAAAQAAPAATAAPAARILGTVTAIQGSSLTVHTEGAGAGDTTLAITPQSRLLRLAPGEKDLKNAAPMQLEELAVGDRVLIRPNSDGSAAILVAMKQGDIRQAHAQEAGDWQRRGIAGIVQSLDAGAGTITLKPQAGAAPVVIHSGASTAVRHYAPDSTAFADAHTATLADIRPGDQLRARGAKDADGAVAADEIVVGSFRNIAGTVLSTDAAAHTVALTDLATHRPVTLQLASSTQLRKLPPEMAARMAHRAGAGAAGGPGATGSASGPTTGTADAAHEHPGGSQAGAGSSRGSDLAGLLQRAPSITLADLNKGDAVMIVASGPGAVQPTAITIIAGVEPLLQGAPEASAGLFSASWNLGGGGADAAGGEGGAPR